MEILFSSLFLNNKELGSAKWEIPSTIGKRLRKEKVLDSIFSLFIKLFVIVKFYRVVDIIFIIFL